jgi:hypothetical protein
MTVVNLQALADAFTTATPHGGAFPDLLHDADDFTYLEFTPGQTSEVTLDDLTLPSGAQVHVALVVVKGAIAACSRRTWRSRIGSSRPSRSSCRRAR